jgi:arylsulfotransferase ASST
VVVSAGCGGGGSTAATPPTMRFASRPDLQPPVVTVLKHTADAAPGYVFIGPKMAAPQQGPEIVDQSGQPVWFDPTRGEVTDVRVQEYRGKPVLTFWLGPAAAPILGTGFGSYFLLDSSYHVVAHVQAGFGRNTGDLHEFHLTPQGTALLTAYRVVHRDTTALGGRPNAPVADSMFQELDVATGKVRFTWHSLGHIALSESEAALPPNTGAGSTAPYDYFHINSVERLANGDYLISARNTWGVYEISGKTGKVLWRLGGKQSDFTMGPGTKFAWQHDVRLRADGTYTLFDDESAPPEAPRSRAIRFRLDPKAHTATLVHADSLPGVLSGSQGNVQELDGGGVFVGWGSTPRYSEFSASGDVLYDATFSAGDDSYRAYLSPWVGTPTTRPAIAVDERSGGRVTLHVSWNGATEVTRWRVLAGDLAHALWPVATVSKHGFETGIVVRSDAPYFAVQALGASGRVLGRSAIVRPGGLAIG